MPIKLNIDKFNSEKNGCECSLHFSKNLKEIEKKLGAYNFRDATVLPEWTFSSKNQHFVAKVGFYRDGVFFSKVLRYPKNIKIETLTEFNNFCIKVIAVLCDKGFILSDADVVEVVRCKDCEYSGKTSEDEEDYYCQNKYGLNGYICDVSYCCNGKRKEGEQDEKV